MASDYRRDITEDLGTLARGLRRLDDISDQDLRSAIRLALGLEPDGPGLDAARRARVRRAVLAALPRGPRRSGP